MQPVMPIATRKAGFILMMMTRRKKPSAVDLSIPFCLSFPDLSTMSNFYMRFISITVLLLLTTSEAVAHGGGLDKLGCHHNRKEGDYHCHRGAKGKPTAPEELTGSGRIVDGDTIWIGETKIRLHGIDAPETKQECHRGDGNPYRCGEAVNAGVKIHQWPE